MKRIYFVIIIILTNLQLVPSENQNKIFVFNHGWHTTLVVPAETAEIYMPFLSVDFQNSDYFEFGWGDFKYYQSENPGKLLAARAVLMPTGSVLHVVSIDGDPALNFMFSESLSLMLPDHQIRNLCKTLSTYFKRDDSRVIKLNHGLYGDSYFYKSRGIYSAINNCNTWTTNVLAKSGIPVRKFGTFTSSSVMRSVKNCKMKNNL